MSFFNKALLLLLVVVLVTKASSTISPTNPHAICSILPINIRPCNGTLRAGPLTGRVPVDCCLALQVTRALSPFLGIRTTCECARLSITAGAASASPAAPPTSPTPNPSRNTSISVSAQIQAACGVNLGFSIDANATCP